MAVRGVVLAAGRGIRMGGVEHKSLVPIGSHEPLLYHLLAALKKSGVDDLMVVTGHRSQDVQEFVAKYWESEATFVFNARYASWGNFHSLRLAVDQSPGFDLLAVNCDIVVHPDVMSRVLGQRGDLVLAVERRLHLDDEDMRVQLKGSRVAGIGKHLKRARSHGEFCGISLVRPPAAGLYADVASDFEWRGRTDVYYEDVYAEIVDRVDAWAATVNPGEYAEVDEPENLAEAEVVVTRNHTALEPGVPSA